MKFPCGRRATHGDHLYYADCHLHACDGETNDASTPLDFVVDALREEAYRFGHGNDYIEGAISTALEGVADRIEELEEEAKS